MPEVNPFDLLLEFLKQKLGAKEVLEFFVAMFKANKLQEYDALKTVPDS